MSQATFVQEGRLIDYTPSADTAAGAVVVRGAEVGIADRAITANTLGALAVRGVYDVAQGAMTFTDGQAVYWDADGNPVGGTAGSGCATETATANAFMGFAIGTTSATDATVRVNLRSVESSAAESLTLAQLGDVGETAYTAGEILVADGNSYEEVAVSGPFALSSAGLLSVVTATVAAAGNDQSNATAITTQGFVLVTAADATTGVKLPAAAAGKVVIIKNADAANAILKVWPNTDDAVNAVAANSAFSMAAKTAAMFIAYDATTWYTVPLVAS